MKLLPILAAAILATAAPAVADEAAPAAATQSLENLRIGQPIVSAEGRRLGRVDALIGDRAAPTAVRLILRGKFVTIPVDTLSADGNSDAFKTTLTYAELR